MEILKTCENFLTGKYMIQVNSRTEADYLYDKLSLLNITWGNGKPLSKGWRLYNYHKETSSMLFEMMNYRGVKNAGIGMKGIFDNTINKPVYSIDKISFLRNI